VLAARMIAHALEHRGYPTWTASRALLAPVAAELPDSDAPPAVVCVSVFGHQPQARIRLIARRLRRRLPQARIVAAAWNAGPDLLDAEAARKLGVDALVANVRELVLHVEHLAPIDGAQMASVVPIPDDDAERIEALLASGALDAALDPLCEETIRHAINAFDAKYAEIAWVDARHVHTPASPLEDASVPRELAPCSWVVGDDKEIVVGDVQRDPRFAHNPRLSAHGIRFYAGVPLRDHEQRPLGALCIMDTQPRGMSAQDLIVLTEMADALMRSIRAHGKRGDAAPIAPTSSA